MGGAAWGAAAGRRQARGQALVQDARALAPVLTAVPEQGREVIVRSQTGAFDLILRGAGFADDPVLREVVEEQGVDLDVLVGPDDGLGELRIRLPMP